jgi:FixJ family two-component response regulator
MIPRSGLPDRRRLDARHERPRAAVLLAARGYSRPIILHHGQGQHSDERAGDARRRRHLPAEARAPRRAVRGRPRSFERDRRRREEQAERTAVESRLKALTGREREVLELIVVGKLNKQIAAELGAAEKTIKVHRGRVMAKLNVRSVAELVNLTARVIGTAVPASGRIGRKSTVPGAVAGAYWPAMDKERPFVAVVDDEESVRAALLRLLRASRNRLRGLRFRRGVPAFDRTAPPDCLVLDLQMAGLNGREVQRQLIGRKSPIPLVMITAHDEPTIREQCLADGASAYLRKPLRGDLLIRSIHAAMAGAPAR